MANLTDNPNGINQEELAKELQRLRDVEGVTFAAIANKTGISRSAISQLVNQGLRVKSEHAQKLLDAVNEIKGTEERLGPRRADPLQDAHRAVRDEGVQRVHGLV